VPSYCDRVLWKSHPSLTADLTCAAYTAHPELRTSDHKPVSAAMQLSVRPPPAVLRRELSPHQVKLVRMRLLRRLSCCSCCCASRRLVASLRAVPKLYPHHVSFSTSLPGAHGLRLRTLQLPTLRLTHVRGADLVAMDLSGKSDPYIIFFLDPPLLAPHDKRAKAPRTAAKRQTLAPVWRDNEVPALRLKALAPADLARCHLVMLLLDKDVRADDRMGAAILPLAQLATSHERAAFTVPVIKSGKRCGELSGYAQITWPTPWRPLASTAGDGARANGRADRACCSVQ
jgi:hypothetical protein